MSLFKFIRFIYKGSWLFWESFSLRWSPHLIQYTYFSHVSVVDITVWQNFRFNELAFIHKSETAKELYRFLSNSYLPLQSKRIFGPISYPGQIWSIRLTTHCGKTLCFWRIPPYTIAFHLDSRTENRQLTFTSKSIYAISKENRVFRIKLLPCYLIINMSLLQIHSWWKLLGQWKQCKSRVLYFGYASSPAISFILRITFEIWPLFAVLWLGNNDNILQAHYLL